MICCAVLLPVALPLLVKELKRSASQLGHLHTGLAGAEGPAPTGPGLEACADMGTAYLQVGHTPWKIVGVLWF